MSFSAFIESVIYRSFEIKLNSIQELLPKAQLNSQELDTLKNNYEDILFYLNQGQRNFITQLDQEITELQNNPNNHLSKVIDLKRLIETTISLLSEIIKLFQKIKTGSLPYSEQIKTNSLIPFTKFLTEIQNRIQTLAQQESIPPKIPIALQKIIDLIKRNIGYAYKIGLDDKYNDACDGISNQELVRTHQLRAKGGLWKNANETKVNDITNQIINQQLKSPNYASTPSYAPCPIIFYGRISNDKGFAIFSPKVDEIPNGRSGGLGGIIIIYGDLWGKDQILLKIFNYLIANPSHFNLFLIALFPPTEYPNINNKIFSKDVLI